MSAVLGLVVECTERCGEVFTVPAEVVAEEPASRGVKVFTLRVTAENPETLAYLEHCDSHFLELEDEEVTT